MNRAIQVFYSYADEDQALINELNAHLSTMERQNLIGGWQRREVLAGMEKEKEIHSYLDSAQIILLLISPDFMASDYCYGTEMSHALQRDQNGEARLIPILLRPTDIQDTPFCHLQMLPRNTVAVTRWANRDEAFSHIALELRRVVQHALTKSKEQWLDEGKILYKTRRYKQALTAYEHALRIDSGFVQAYSRKGDALYKLQHYQEAVSAYEQAIQLAPSVVLYEKLGNMFFLLERFVDALEIYTRALSLGPASASLFINKGNALAGLKQYALALVSYEEAIGFHADDPVAYNNKGRALHHLERYTEAISAFEEAIRLKPDFARAYKHMGDAFSKLGKTQEASFMYARSHQLRQQK